MSRTAPEAATSIKASMAPVLAIFADGDAIQVKKLLEFMRKQGSQMTFSGTAPNRFLRSYVAEHYDGHIPDRAPKEEVMDFIIKWLAVEPDVAYMLQVVQRAKTKASAPSNSDDEGEEPFDSDDDIMESVARA